ncbi:MAG: dienelactone hydrolase family protein [Salibacteraceae bacterium]
MKTIVPLLLFIFFQSIGFSFERNNENLIDEYSYYEVEINLAVENQEDAIAYLLESKTPTDNWLFIYPDKWGVTDIVRNDAFTLWNDLKNVNVLIIDLNDGIVPSDNTEAMRVLMRNDVERDHLIIESALEFAGENSKIGSLGWCNGGSWSMQTAIKAKEKEVACVMYYGMPETNTKKLKNLNSDVLAIYGSMDTYITPTVAKSFKNKMESAGKRVIELTYEGKGEFANRQSDLYNREYANNAYSKVIAYLNEKFE